MFGLILAIPIVLFSGLLGIRTLISVMSAIKKSKKGKEFYICSVVSMLCLTLCLSFFMCVLNGEHIDPEFSKKEFEIEKLTANTVCFNDKEVDLSDSRVIIEKPHNQFNNVVLEKKEDYHLKWLWKFKMVNAEYHVFLSKENYNRLQNLNVIYERGN